MLVSARKAFRRRGEAEQGPGVLAHLQLGEESDIAADWPDSRECLAAELDEIADARDVDHRAVGGGFGKRSGEARDHQP